MPEREQRCETCEWWNNDTKWNIGPQFGECHGAPPAIFSSSEPPIVPDCDCPMAYDMGTAFQSVEFPRTGANDYCGMWKPREKEGTNA